MKQATGDVRPSLASTRLKRRAGYRGHQACLPGEAVPPRGKVEKSLQT